MIQRLRFEGVTGEPLAAVFHPPHPTGPDSGVRGSLLVVHCFTCSKDLKADWVGKKCGNFNTKTNKCLGSGS